MDDEPLQDVDLGQQQKKPSSNNKSSQHQQQAHARNNPFPTPFVISTAGIDDSRRTIQWRVQLGLLSVANRDGWASQLASQRAKYAQLVELYPYPDSDNQNQQQVGKKDNNTTTSDDDDEAAAAPPAAAAAAAAANNNDRPLDPLTAMWMEDQKQSDRLEQLDLQYRKEKARRKRGMHQQREMESEVLNAAEQRVVALQIIDKDLARLAHPDQVHGTAVCCEFRKEILRQVLYIYSCTLDQAVSNSGGGYQQGMHEIASYILYAAELEETPVDQNLYADTFSLLQVIVTQLLPAYDVAMVAPPSPARAARSASGNDDDDDVDAASTTARLCRGNSDVASHNAKPLESMGQRIMQQIARQDPMLHQCWTNGGSSLSTVPPQLIFTKWIRLLFCREVTNVIALWDVLFRNVPPVNRSGVVTAVAALQHVAEAVAVARVLVHRAVLLEKHYAQPVVGGSNSSDLLHYLMNMPVEESVASIHILVGPLVRGESVAQFLPVFVPPTSAITAAAPPAPSGVGMVSFDGSRIRNASSSLTQAFQSMGSLSGSGNNANAANNNPVTPPRGGMTGSASFSFSSVKNKLQHVSSIGKLFHDGGSSSNNNTAAAAAAAAPQQQQQQQQHPGGRNYDDPPPRRGPLFDPPVPPLNNNNNPPSQQHQQHQQQPSHPLAAASPEGPPSRRMMQQQRQPAAAASRRRQQQPAALSSSSSASLAVQMQYPLSVLQQFALKVQQERQQAIPHDVWEALASLEMIRKKLGQQEPQP